MRKSYKQEQIRSWAISKQLKGNEAGATLSKPWDIPKAGCSLLQSQHKDEQPYVLTFTPTVCAIEWNHLR